MNAQANKPQSWLDADQIAKVALSQGLPDLTCNADHYLNVAETLAARGDGTLPDWYQVAKVTVTIGHHTFLNLLGP